MMFTMNANRHMSPKSAHFAQANGSCAAASMQSANFMMLTVDAIILASILISLLSLGLLGLVVRTLLVALLVVVALVRTLYIPERKKKAYL